MKRILFCCDKSGGHIYPALILARRLQKVNPKAKIYFFAPSNIFKQQIKDSGFKVYGAILKKRNILLELIVRAIEAVYVIAKVAPTKTIGFGGRDSFFIILFLGLMSLDVSIYEPNVIMGKANRFLANFAQKVFLGFPIKRKGKKNKFAGIPIRDDFNFSSAKEAREKLGLEDKFTILCFGGSQGSAFLNEAFADFIQEKDGDFQAIHICGQKQYSEIKHFYDTINKKVVIKSYYSDMALLYQAADIVVCRAGALTLAELAYFRKAAVLVPYPYAGAHQEENARYFSQHRAAVVVYQNSLGRESLKREINNLCQDKKLQEELKENISKINIWCDADNFYTRIFNM